MEGVQNGMYFTGDESLPTFVVEFIETFNHLKQNLTGRYEMSGGRILHYSKSHCVEFNQKGTFKKIKGVGVINEVFGQVLYEIDPIALSILKSKLSRINKAR